MKEGHQRVSLRLLLVHQVRHRVYHSTVWGIAAVLSYHRTGRVLLVIMM